MKILAAVAAAALLAGCSTATLEREGLPGTPAAFRGAAAGEERAMASAPASGWWTAFADPVLDGLVQRAGVEHTDIAGAAARLAQARAMARSTAAGGLPQLGLRAGASRQG